MLHGEHVTNTKPYVTKSTGGHHWNGSISDTMGPWGHGVAPLVSGTPPLCYPSYCIAASRLLHLSGCQRMLLQLRKQVRLLPNPQGQCVTCVTLNFKSTT